MSQLSILRNFMIYSVIYMFLHMADSKINTEKVFELVLNSSTDNSIYKICKISY